MAKKPVETEEGERLATLAECNAQLNASMLASLKASAVKKGEVIREIVYMPAPTEPPAPEQVATTAAPTDATKVQ